MTGLVDIAMASAILRAGGVVAFPTETVYGLGANAFDASAVARVFAAKGRPSHNPLIVHVHDRAHARDVVSAWPASADLLARAFWPGPLTIVLPRADRVPPIVTGGGPRVGVRCPAHPLARSLIEAVGSPLVGPSANRSGSISPTTAQHVLDSLPEIPVLDGGPCTMGIESTVLLLDAVPRILRPGVISADAIAAVLGVAVNAPADPEITRAGTSSDDRMLDSPALESPPLESPGMLRSHYAPTAPCILIDAAGLPSALPRDGRGQIVGPVVILAPAGLAPTWPHDASITLRTLPADAPGYAASLYAALRDADALRPTRIVILRPPATDRDPIWTAVLDRLTRASADRD